MRELSELKIKLAEIHIKTLGLTNLLLTLDKSFKKSNIDKVLKHSMGKEISDCLELIFQIRAKAEPKENK